MGSKAPTTRRPSECDGGSNRRRRDTRGAPSVACREANPLPCGMVLVEREGSLRRNASSTFPLSSLTPTRPFLAFTLTETATGTYRHACDHDRALSSDCFRISHVTFRSFISLSLASLDLTAEPRPLNGTRSRP